MQKQAKCYYHTPCPCAFVSAATWNYGRQAVLDGGAMNFFVTNNKFYAQLFICLNLFLFPLPNALAQEIKFTDILITNNVGQILIYARSTNCFTKSTEAAILAGVPTTLTFYIDFMQTRPYWWDKRLSRRIIKHTIKYDNIEKNFHISSDNGQHESATFQSFESAKRAMTQLNGASLYPFRALAKDKSYYLKMKAAIKDQPHLPLQMDYLSFFTSFCDFGMGWQRQIISYRSLTPQ